MIFDSNPDKTSMLQAINEVYFGKTPEILAMEKQLHKFRNKYMDLLNPIKKFSVNSDEDLLKFNRMVEDYFGFGVFSLYIIDIKICNAFTLALPTHIDTINMSSNFIVNKNTFKFNKQANYSCLVAIFSGIIFNSNYTTSEVMALILHEIGHNFFTVLDNKYSVLAKFKILVLIIQALFNFLLPSIFIYAIAGSEKIKNIILKTSRFLRMNKNILSFIEDCFLLSINFGINLSNDITSISNILLLGFNKYLYMVPNITTKLLNPFTYIFGRTLYNDERVADNFSTIYGYGAELSSAVNKFDSIEFNSNNSIKKLFSNVPILSNIYCFNSDIVSIILGLFDEHPIALSRANDQLKLLEREIKKEDLDPKMRKALENDIKKLKNELKNITNITISIKNKSLIRNIYFNALYYATDSKDIKDYLLNDNDRFEIYDNIYNEKLEGGKK